MLARPGWRHIARLVERVAAEPDWVDLPAGPSTVNSRVWQWWVRRIPDPDSQVGAGAWARWVIARRRHSAPDERDYYLAWGPPDTPVEELVMVPGARWRVEEAIKLAKSACGLADDEVRSWHGWYRHITLAHLAAAFLAVQAAHGNDPPPADGGERGPHPQTTEPIVPARFSAFEIRRLVVLVQPQPPPAERIRRGLAWSLWRRLHQAVAQACHRRRNRPRPPTQAPIRPPPRQHHGTTAAQPIYN